jgi:hypothetical protein
MSASVYEGVEEETETLETNFVASGVLKKNKYALTATNTATIVITIFLFIFSLYKLF